MACTMAVARRGQQRSLVRMFAEVNASVRPWARAAVGSWLAPGSAGEAHTSRLAGSARTWTFGPSRGVSVLCWYVEADGVLRQPGGKILSGLTSGQGELVRIRRVRG
jgi:hypothetical protein